MTAYESVIFTYPIQVQFDHRPTFRRTDGWDIRLDGPVMRLIHAERATVVEVPVTAVKQMTPVATSLEAVGKKK